MWVASIGSILTPQVAIAQVDCVTQCNNITGGCPNVVNCPGGTFCVGTPASECIFGTDLNDFIIANGGDDCVCAEGGDDTVDGGPGSDFIFGGDGSDIVDGGDDPDQISGDDGDDDLSGGAGNDIILGGMGSDSIFGDAGNDIINGDDGDDTIEGGDDDDQLNGQAGSDTIRGDDGNDTLNGQEGNDTLEGGPGDDDLDGATGGDILRGGPGDDELDGGDDNDQLFGGDDSDELIGGNGDDILNGEGGDDLRLDGDDGDDTINGGPGMDIANGGQGIDIISGGDGDDVLSGGTEADIINGDAGNDTLNGDSENDRLDGGTGDDNVFGNSGIDVCLNFTTTDFSCDLFTQASVSEFDAFLEQGTPIVRWVTSSESGTVGFRVLREVDGSWTEIHDGLLPGLLDAPQGGTYNLADTEASPNTPLRYLLIEVDVIGHEATHGPFEVVAASEDRGLIKAGHRFGRAPHQPSTDATTKKAVTPPRQSAGAAVGLYLGVEDTGLHSVSADTIAATLGVSVDVVSDRLLNGEMALTEDGLPVAWSTDATGSELTFFGRARENLYTSERLYRLAEGAGDAITERTAAPSDVSEVSTFVATEHLERNAVPGILVSQDPTVDFWYWQLIVASKEMPTNAEVSFELENVSGEGNLSVRLHGVVDLPHEIVVQVNGVEVGATSFEGVTLHEDEFSIPDGVLVEGNNTLTLAAAEPSDSMVYLDSADVEYTRDFTTSKPTIEFRANETGSVELTGLDGSAAEVFDVSDPRKPVRLVGLVNTAAGKRFDVDDEAAYFAASESARKQPTSVWADTASDLRATDNAIDHLIIAPALFVGEAEALAQHRQSGGLRSEVVELQDVYDEFSGGTPDPHAIRALLLYARNNWDAAPEFVVLAGDGSFDYLDVFESGGNFLPPLLALTPKGMFSSDSSYADLDGADGIPDVAIGRLPVGSGEELTRVIERIVEYEAQLDAIPDRVTVYAGNPDDDRDFTDSADQFVIDLPGGWETTSVYGPDFDDPAGARDAFVNAVQDSPRVVTYFGHSGPTALGKPVSIFNVADATSLETEGPLPIFAMMTCLTSRFAVPSGLFPEEQSLSEALVTSDGGAIAVWGASGDTIHEQIGPLAQTFLDELDAGNETRIGPIVNRAYRSLDGTELGPEMVKIFHLFGDPALRVVKASEEPPGVDDPPNPPPQTPDDGPGVIGSDSGSGGCSASPEGRGPFVPLLWMVVLAYVIRRRRVAA